MELAEKIEALQRASVVGELLGEDAHSVRVRAGGAIVEIPRRHVAQVRESAHGLEFVLEKNAVVVVSAVVSAKKGFLVDDVFGELSPNLCADNCNCNCNCGGSSNCNCNCNCGRSIYAEGRGTSPTARAPAARPFRRSDGGSEKA